MIDSKQDIITESVLGIYLFQSTKAIRILFMNGESMWVPKSLIRNIEDIDISNFEEPQCYEIDKWYCEVNKLEVEL